MRRSRNLIRIISTASCVGISTAHPTLPEFSLSEGSSAAFCMLFAEFCWSYLTMVNITTVRNVFAKIFGVVSTIINVTVFVCHRIISPQRGDNSMVCATTQEVVVEE